MGQEPGEIRQEIEETRDQMGDTVDALAYKADVKTRVKESISDRRDRLMSQMQGTGQRIGEAAPDGHQLKEGGRQAVGIAQENPVGLAIGGVAAGFLVGMMLPSTKVEDERVGPLSDQVKETAAETGKEALARGREVAEQAVEGAKEAGGGAMESMKDAAQEQMEGLKETAKEGAQEVGDRARAS
jgi:hypothetical protein